MMDIKQLLQYKNIPIKITSGDQVAIDCPINNCDVDSSEREAHFYINYNNGTFFCHKCQEKGSAKKLLSILGIPDTELAKKKFSPFNNERLENTLKNQPEVMSYLTKKRGLTVETIEKRHLGFGRFYGKNWITIPYFDEYGNFLNLYKLRAPEGSASNTKYIFYPKQSVPKLYGLELLDKTLHYVIVCEGEFDAMALHQNSCNVLSVPTGARTSIDKWVHILEPFEDIHLCFDNDKAGEEGAKKLGETLALKFPTKRIIKMNIPHEEGIKDASDLLMQKDGFTKLNGNTEIIHRPPIMKSEMSLGDLARILDLTIKDDRTNKLIAFLCFLSMYTENSQFNIIFTGPSSTGKSYIPLEIAKLFPEEDVIALGKVTNQAFFYEQGEYDEETNSMIIDYSRKTILFMDQPNTEVISKIRPLLSHDKKVITNKMTDSNLKHGTKTKTAKIVGYCSVVFCTTATMIDEQEQTRVIMLSPDASPEKIRKVVLAKIQAQSNSVDITNMIENNIERTELKNRILDIKHSGIEVIKIPNEKLLSELFYGNDHHISGRDTRDITKLFSLVHSIALLNYRFRDRTEEGELICTDEDIYAAFDLWKDIKLSQETGISPHVLNFIQTILKDMVSERLKRKIKQLTFKREDFIKQYLSVYKTIMDDKSMIDKYLRPLCYAGILDELKGTDRREHIYQLTMAGINILNLKEGTPVEG